MYICIYVQIVSEGCLSSAIAASAAVPLLFAPVKLGVNDDHSLVDGAFGDPSGLGCCTAIPPSGRVLHIGFPGQIPGVSGAGCPSLVKFGAMKVLVFYFCSCCSCSSFAYKQNGWMEKEGPSPPPHTPFSKHNSCFLFFFSWIQK
jgi:hypothetical protein